jgi:hypothetical protein
MPDPSDPTPVSVAKRGGMFVVVDKDGKKLAGEDPTGDSAKAAGMAARVNRSWARAKSERKSKGGPEISEAIVPFIGHRSGGRLTTFFDPHLHPRNRLGEFSKLLSDARSGKHGDIHLPGGVTVEAGLGDRLRVSGEGTKPEVFHTPEVAAAHALYLHDLATKEAPTIGVRLKELAPARAAAASQQRVGEQFHIDDIARKLRLERSAKQIAAERELAQRHVVRAAH